MIDRFRIKTFEQFVNENITNDKIIFVRTRNFDNQGTTKKLPYEGIQCWAIYEDDFGKYVDELELSGGRRKNVEIINPAEFDVYALNYRKAHKYVMGQTEEIPQLEPFDETKHILKFNKTEPKHMLEYASDLLNGVLCYQIILVSK